MVSEKVGEKVAAPGRVKWPGAPEGETTQTLAEGSPWPCEMAGSPGERNHTDLVGGRSANGYVKGLWRGTREPLIDVVGDVVSSRVS